MLLDVRVMMFVLKSCPPFVCEETGAEPWTAKIILMSTDGFYRKHLLDILQEQICGYIEPIYFCAA